jgi:hypothetical protein
LNTVFVAGVIANKYLNGGAVWTRLNWILGFRKLGFEVCFVEQIGRDQCLSSDGEPCPLEESVQRQWFERITEAFGLSGSAALIEGDGERIWGVSRDELLHKAEDAVLLVNISGHLTWEPLLKRLKRKAYVDLDPGYTQYWHADGIAGSRLEGHDLYYTVGENIGMPGCPIPTGDIQWRPIRQPVVLEHWPKVDGGRIDRFTTIASWRGPFGPVQRQDHSYGLKVHEFRKFIDLPRQAPAEFEIALDIHPADDKDRNLLHQHGWRIADPKEVTPDPWAFRRYVQESGAEFSVAQGIYVETGSGWFSDRTVRYLASGKPALVQDTGFSRNLPTGEGLLAFRTMEAAVRGVREIVSDPERHRWAARAIAEVYFDSDRVLSRLADDAGVAP